MKKLSYVLAALAAVAFAIPSIASAEDAKPGMKEGMHKEGMMHGDKPMMSMHHRHHHHHMMKRGM
jgi:Ni/Co efflux regulator RcnB